METQNKNTTNVVILKTEKSMAVAVILAFLFGPLGLLYASVKGGLIMMLVSAVVLFFTLGIGLLITVPACIIWAIVAVNNYNRSLSSSVTTEN